MISKQVANELAKELKIDIYTIYREYVQIAFLSTLYSSASSKGLYFKGGTALRLMYGSKRFSEDLDFNSELAEVDIRDLVSSSAKRLEPEIPGIIAKDLDSLAGYGAKLYLNTDISVQPLTVKLDFSFRDKTEQPEMRPIDTQLPVKSYILISCFSKEEILAEKLRTLYTRSKGRDIYDLWYLLHTGTVLNPGLVKKKMRMIQTDYHQEELIDKVQKFDDKVLEQDLNKFLPMSDRPIVPKLKSLIIEKIPLS